MTAQLDDTVRHDARVYVLVFERGALESAADRSEELAALREKMSQAPLEPEHAGGHLTTWIERCFDRRYR